MRKKYKKFAIASLQLSFVAEFILRCSYSCNALLEIKQSIRLVGFVALLLYNDC